MKIVVSVPDPGAINEAERAGADVLEIRRDLMQGNAEENLRQLRQKSSIPWIATIRTTAEGGRFSGSPGEWRLLVDPLLPLADMVDIEYTCHEYAPELRTAGKTIIASYHTHTMPSPGELAAIGYRLRSYGDIPKIVVEPRTKEDVISLLSFTLSSARPVIVSTMGGRFRYARALLPLFGSEMVFCHAGTPTAEGQYHVCEMQQLLGLLAGKM